MKSIILITSASPKQNGIGSIFLRDIIASAPDFRVQWRVVEPFMLNSVRSGSGLFWRALNAVMASLGVLNDIRIGLFQKWRLTAQADVLEREFRASAATKIWVTTSSPELICIAQELAQRGIDIRVTVWDAPEYLIQNLRMSKRREAQILDRFWLLLRQARSCSVVSDSMKTEYAMRVTGSRLYLRGVKHNAPRTSCASSLRVPSILSENGTRSFERWTPWTGPSQGAKSNSNSSACFR